MKGRKEGSCVRMLHPIPLESFIRREKNSPGKERSCIAIREVTSEIVHAGGTKHIISRI